MKDLMNKYHFIINNGISISPGSEPPKENEELENIGETIRGLHKIYSSGRWLEDEHFKFIEAICKYGTKVLLLAPSITSPSKKPAQTPPPTPTAISQARRSSIKNGPALPRFWNPAFIRSVSPMVHTKHGTAD